MTYLQLFQRFLREASFTGEAPTTVSSVTGDRLQALDWLNDAYEDIQRHQTNWFFMINDFSFETVAGVREYSVSTIGLTDHERWKINSFGDLSLYLTSLGVSGEQYLEYISWEDYRKMFLFGTTRTTQGMPGYFTVRPDKSLDFYPIPNDIYTITGEYYKKPAQLIANTDEPIFPPQFHMIIVWRALMFCGAFQAANEKYSHGQNEYKKMLRRLQFDQLPKLTFGAPLV